MKPSFFDAEGVIVDTEKLWDKSQKILLGKRGLEFDRDYLKPRMAGQNLVQGAKVMIDYYAMDENPEELAVERAQIIGDLFESEINFIDGFLGFIDTLRTDSMQYAVATAMQKRLMSKVNRQLNLSDYFGNRIYFIEDVENKSKPHPDVFLHAAKQLGIRPSNCIVIEDAPNGIEAARRAGMLCIGIATTFTEDLLQDADFVGKSFEDIAHFLHQSGIKLEQS